MPDYRSLLIGFSVGSIIAGVSTLLLTPQSGKQIRNNLKYSTEKTEAIITQMRKNTSSLTNDLISLSRDSSSIIKDVASELKEDYQTYKKDIEPNIRAIQDGIKKLESKISEKQNNSI
jgi:gas vesicle protein